MWMFCICKVFDSENASLKEQFVADLNKLALHVSRSKPTGGSISPERWGVHLKVYKMQPSLEIAGGGETLNLLVDLWSNSQPWSHDLGRAWKNEIVAA